MSTRPEPSHRPSAPPVVRVVTVSYGSQAVLPTFVRSLAGATTRAYELVVVDNASPVPLDPSLVPPGADLLRLDENRGYGGGANAGAEGARTEWLVVANPDIEWAPGSLDALLDHAARFPRGGAFGPAILEPSGEPYPSARRFPSLFIGAGHAALSRIWPSNPWSRAYRQEGDDPEADRQTDWLSGACLLLRRAAFDSLGGFDESYFMFFEDVDLAWRLAERGCDSVYVPAAKVYHDQGHSWRERPAAMLRAHHASAYQFLARRHPHWYEAPLRMLLRAGLWVRLQLQIRTSAGAAERPLS